MSTVVVDAVEHLVRGIVDNPDFIEVPNTYRRQFETNPEKSLRDLAGIPPATNDPFISLVDKIELCRERWIERYGRDEGPVDDNPTRPKIAEWLKGNGDPRRRTAPDTSRNASSRE